MAKRPILQWTFYMSKTQRIKQRKIDPENHGLLPSENFETAIRASMENGAHRDMFFLRLQKMTPEALEAFDKRFLRLF